MTFSISRPQLTVGDLKPGLIQRMIGREMVINETSVIVPRFSSSNETFNLVRQ